MAETTIDLIRAGMPATGRHARKRESAPGVADFLGIGHNEAPAFRRSGVKEPPMSCRLSRRCVLWLFVVGLSLASREAMAAPPLWEFSEKPLTIVCLGDSVTGVYYHTGGRRAYPEMLEVALKKLHPDTPVKVINAGISGHTADMGLERLERDVLVHRPDLVTVSFGLNDVAGRTPEAYRSNLEKIVAKCREQHCRVVLCTPNAVIETGGRPRKRIEEYCQILREVAKQSGAAVCDQYQAGEALRAQDPRAWRLTLSDEIHPNLDGHKRMAEELANVIAGRKVSLQDVPPSDQPLRKTKSLIDGGKPIRVLAMSSCRAFVEAALKALAPSTALEIIDWPVEGKSLGELERYAQENARKLKVDLVVLAVPRAAYRGAGRELDDEAFVRSYSWVMNWSLSFGTQEWDCIVVHPSVLEPGKELNKESNKEPEERDRLVRQLVRAQDLVLVDRPVNEPNTDTRVDAASLLKAWFARELRAAK